VKMNDIDVNHSLAAAYLLKGEVDKAGDYLSRIPTPFTRREDIAITLSLYHLKKGEIPKAKEVISKRMPAGIQENDEVAQKLKSTIERRSKK
jgi:hypothetical protein